MRLKVAMNSFFGIFEIGLFMDLFFQQSTHLLLSVGGEICHDVTLSYEFASSQVNFSVSVIDTVTNKLN